MGLEFHALHNQVPGGPEDATSLSVAAGLPSRAHLPCRYWHPLLNSLHTQDRHALLLEVVNSMSDVHVIPDRHSRLRSVQATLAVGQLQEALDITEQMWEVSDTDATQQPDLDIYLPILEYLASNDLPREMTEVVERMDACGVSIDRETWSRMGRMRRFDLVLEALERNHNNTDR
jgi:hypothetical protein